MRDSKPVTHVDPLLIAEINKTCDYEVTEKRWFRKAVTTTCENAAGYMIDLTSDVCDTHMHTQFYCNKHDYEIESHVIPAMLCEIYDVISKNYRVLNSYKI